MKKQLFSSFAAFAGIIAPLRDAPAADFEPLGKAVANVLGTTKASKKTVSVGGQPTDVYYSKGANGKAERFAVIQKGIYEPNCTHTWVVGLEAATAKVLDVRVVEMSCPHAFPTKAANFLGQYKGRSPASVAKLSDDVTSVAKATGSSDLTTAAVKKSIQIANQLKGKL